MTKSNFIKYLKDKYKAQKVNNSDWRFVLVENEHEYLTLMPSIGGVPSNQRIVGVPVVSPQWYKSLAESVFHEDLGGGLFIGNQYSKVTESGKLTEQDIDQMVSACIDWSNEINQLDNIRKVFDEHLSGFNSFPPLRAQELFILSNIIQGNNEKLKEIRNDFLTNNSMGFTPLFRSCHFDRAIELSMKYKSGELVSPLY